MITVQQLAFFLIDKNEHYPLSDEFIEHYQQSRGGYIKFARDTGRLVDRKRHEPNQKWHFYESWLIRSLQDGSVYWDKDAEKAVYNKIQCPELLLWLLEAVGVDASAVEAAKEIAEEGKERKDYVSTIAKEIRERVPWDVIEKAMKSQNSSL